MIGSRSLIFAAFLLSASALLLPPITPAEVKLVRDDSAASLELWETALGRLWIPKPGSAVIKHLEWEQSVQKVYDHPSARVSRGDVVLDCGAHIGGFARVALAAGARLVVAIEPEKSNVLALRRNCADAIMRGKVILVQKGVWDKHGNLPLHLSSIGDSHSVSITQNFGKDQIIELTTIDDIVRNLKLSQVDYIKLDIEGSELNALKGAIQTLKRWRPRLAVSAYHKKGDPAAICSAVWEVQPGYLVDSKDLLHNKDGSEFPKVLFFH